MRMTTIVLETVIEETSPFSIRLRRRSMYSCFISITSLWENLHSPLIKEANRLSGIHIAPDGSRRPFLLYHTPLTRSTAFTQGFPDGRSSRGALSPPRTGGAAGGVLLALFQIARSNQSQIAGQMTRSPGAVMIYPLARACPRRAVNPSRPPIKYPRKTQRAHGRALRAASAPFFMRSGAPSYDYKILSPYNYSVCF